MNYLAFIAKFRNSQNKTKQFRFTHHHQKKKKTANVRNAFFLQLFGFMRQIEKQKKKYVRKKLKHFSFNSQDNKFKKNKKNHFYVIDQQIRSIAGKSPDVEKIDESRKSMHIIVES